MAKTKTAVISFRVPVEMVEKVDRQAKRAKKVRAEFVKGLFVPTFEMLFATSEQSVKQTN
jgi:predicted DNA-binding protein